MSSFSDEYFCPRCGAILNDQPGFDPEAGAWRCTECGEMLMDDNVYNGELYEGVAWFCDGCGALLNRQSGFSDYNVFWDCTECGHRNWIMESEIGNGKRPEFTCPDCGSVLDNQSYFSKDEDDWECTECGAHLHHDYSDDPYEVVEETENNTEKNRSDSSTCYSSSYTSGYSYSSYSGGPSIKTKKRKRWKIRILSTLFIMATLLSILTFFEVKMMIPVGTASADYVGENFEDVISDLKDAGFTWIRTREIADLPADRAYEEGKVESVTIGFFDSFDEEAKYPFNFRTVVAYHALKKCTTPISSKKAKGENYKDIENMFIIAGFTNITLEVEYDIVTGWLTDDGEVGSVTINEDKKFTEGKEYRADAEVVITYHTYRKNKPK